MAYYFSTTVPLSFDEAVARVVLALKSEGFGVITDIDVEKTLREEIGVDFRKYGILGACNPSLAYEALQLEDKIGTMLPCNVWLCRNLPSTAWRWQPLIPLRRCRRSTIPGSKRQRPRSGRG